MPVFRPTTIVFLRCTHLILAVQCAEVNDRTLPGPFSSFRVQGRIYARYGPLHPSHGQTPHFLQLFIFDPDSEQELELRHSRQRNLDREILQDLQTMFHLNNAWVRQFQLAANADIPNVRLLIRPPNPSGTCSTDTMQA